MKKKSNTTTLGVRVSADEVTLLQKAIAISGPGDRGGVSGWVRRVALAEAQRLLKSEVRTYRGPAGG